MQQNTRAFGRDRIIHFKYTRTKLSLTGHVLHFTELLRLINKKKFEFCSRPRSKHTTGGLWAGFGPNRVGVKERR